MASEERSAADPVSRVEGGVLANAWRYNFFNAVALLERLTPGAPRIGGVGPAAEEAIRFRHDPSMVFSTSDVSAINVRERRGGDPFASGPRKVYEVVSTFLGLTGAVTPLPLYIAEEVATEDPDAPARREFLDLFHHRLISLFYRARAKYNYPAEYTSDASDIWSKRVLALCGVDTFESPAAGVLPPWRLLRLAPLLATRARTARGLQLVLEDVLGEGLEGATISIEQFVGRWVDIHERQRIKLGVANTTLGVDTVLGSRVFDRGGKFRVVIGPLSDRGLKRLSPGGDLFPLVRGAISLYCKDDFESDLEIVLGGAKRPTFRLSRKNGSRLGKDGWLGRRREETRVVVGIPFDVDPKSVVEVPPEPEPEPEPEPLALTPQPVRHAPEPPAALDVQSYAALYAPESASAWSQPRASFEESYAARSLVPQHDPQPRMPFAEPDAASRVAPASWQDQPLDVNASVHWQDQPLDAHASTRLPSVSPFEPYAMEGSGSVPADPYGTARATASHAPWPATDAHVAQPAYDSATYAHGVEPEPERLDDSLLEPTGDANSNYYEDEATSFSFTPPSESDESAATFQPPPRKNPHAR